MGDTDGIEWWSEAPDPRDGVAETLLFVVEALLAPAIILRVSAHTVATMALTDTRDPDVDTGLGLGWAVRNTDLPQSDQLTIAALWGSAMGVGWLWVAETGQLQSPALWLIAAANWLYVTGDGAWLVADWLRDRLL
jgi:hypothetical protein